MTYGCHNRPQPKGIVVELVRFVGGLAHIEHHCYPHVTSTECQHDSASDPGCAACEHQRSEPRNIPTGAGA